VNSSGGEKSPSSRPWGVTGRDGRRLSKAQSMAVPGITGIGGGEGEGECNGDLIASRSSSTSSLDRTHPPSTSHHHHSQQQQHSPLSTDSKLNNKRGREGTVAEPPPLDRANTEFVTSFQFLQTHASRQQKGGGEPECTLWIGMSTGWCLALRIHLPPAEDRLMSNVVVAPSGRGFLSEAPLH